MKISPWIRGTRAAACGVLFAASQILPEKKLQHLGKVSTAALERFTDKVLELSPDEIVQKYEGTRLGRQELYAEILTDAPGALWTRDSIRHLALSGAPTMRRVVVGLDPPASSEERSNEAGIVAMGIGTDDRGYVLEDASGIMTPKEWATKSIAVLKRWGGYGNDGRINVQQLGTIVAEINQGGEMVETVIKSVDANVPVKKVRANKGKWLRAEPVSALYEQGKVDHLGNFEQLEDQMCSYVQDIDRKNDGSPDRLDALVWAATELFPSIAMKPVQLKKREMKVR